MYFSFIRPLLEYGDIVWSNCTIEQSNLIEAIQIETARIVTGATKLCEINRLYDDLKWQKLIVRRDQHKLTMFYKMTHNLSPEYLQSLVPARNELRSTYTLRNSTNYSLIQCKTTLYSNSFLPSTVQNYNKLPEEIKNITSLTVFKSRLPGNTNKPPCYYIIGTRKLQIQHCRLRLDCSPLNQFLYRRNLTNSPLCSCGVVESTDHYLLRCPNFDNPSQHYLNNLPCPLLLQNLLFGSEYLSIDQNMFDFIQVQKYIEATKRFA